MYDLLIKNATIVDGSGEAAYIGNVAVADGIIEIVGDGKTAKEEIDAEGMMLSPGFIDSHSHSDYTIGEDNQICYEGKVSMGVTTEVVGQCGHSLFPINQEKLALQQGLFRSFLSDAQLEKFNNFLDFKSFYKYAEGVDKVQNYAFNVGHCTVRAAVMGTDDRKPTEEELEQMKAFVREAMEHGCIGITSGLIYIPGTYSQTEELVELCKVVKEYGGMYATHMRNEGDFLVEAVKEAIYIAETAGVPLVISHHKACGKKNWGKSVETLRIIQEARDRGMTIMVDQYPFTYCQTNLNVCIPPKHFTDGVDALAENLRDKYFRLKVKAEMSDVNCGYNNMYLDCGSFENIFVAASPLLPEAEGRFVHDYAIQKGIDDFDAYFDILMKNKGGGSGIFFSMNEEDLYRIYQDPHTAVGSDAITSSRVCPVHPRYYASFTKPIAEFCRDKKLVSIEEAIRKQTSMPAQMWGLKNKGLVKNGYDADLVLFDFDKLRAEADYTNGRVMSKGIKKVILGGKVVFEDMHFTGETPGKCILREQ